MVHRQLRLPRMAFAGNEFLLPAHLRLHEQHKSEHKHEEHRRPDECHERCTVGIDERARDQAEAKEDEGGELDEVRAQIRDELEMVWESDLVLHARANLGENVGGVGAGRG